MWNIVVEYSSASLEYLHESAEVFEVLINTIFLGAIRQACASEMFSHRMLPPTEHGIQVESTL